MERLRDSIVEDIENLDYISALKKIGILYNVGDKNANIFEAQILFCMKEYDRVILLLKDKLSSCVATDEIFIASMVMLGRVDRVNELLKNGTLKISRYCSAYIQRILSSYSEDITREYTVTEYEQSFFKEQIILMEVEALTIIYENYNEYLMLRNEEEKNALKKMEQKIKDDLARISIIDPFIDDIKACIKKGKQIEKKLIVALLHLYLEANDEDKVGKLLFSNIGNILCLLDVEIRVNYEGVGLDSMIYGSRIVEQIKRGNNQAKRLAVALTIAKEAIDIGGSKQLVIGEFWTNVIKKECPELIRDSEQLKVNEDIYNTLSPMGKNRFIAAIWQYEMLVGDNYYGSKDAGMLCLSYMRIIELEINTRIIKKLHPYFEKLQNLYFDLYGVRQDDKGRYLYDKWGIFKSLDSKKFQGAELGPLRFFFTQVSKGEDKIAKEIQKIFKDEILTSVGVEAVLAGVMSEMISDSKREKYRNPPAHTRYVSVATAIECKEYVEKALMVLDSYIR